MWGKCDLLSPGWGKPGEGAAQGGYDNSPSTTSQREMLWIMDSVMLELLLLPVNHLPSYLLCLTSAMWG